MALVVIGGVAAGLSAAARARRVDPRLDIVVLEKGPAISYGACGLPYFIEGRVREARQLIVYTPEYFRKERNIEVRTGARVVSIAHPRREVELQSGGRVHYDHLIIAAGARCDTAGIAGAEQPHVFTLHTLEDAERMRRFIREKRPRRAVVIGAGYIGVEAADALRRNGLRVTVLERSANVLLRDDPHFTAAVRKQLEKHGVELRCGVQASAIEPESVAGVACLGLGNQNRPPLIIAGAVAMTLGILFISPLAIRALAMPARRAPVAVRLALRDLARHQARSGAALAAISLALGITAAIIISSAADKTAANAGNLPDTQILVWTGQSDGPNGPAIPVRTPAQLRVLAAAVHQIAGPLTHSEVTALDMSVNPADKPQPGGHGSQAGQPVASLGAPQNPAAGGRGGTYSTIPLYVATPAVLRYLGISPATITPAADFLTAAAGQLVVTTPSTFATVTHVQRIQAPSYASQPTSLMTLGGLHRRGWTQIQSGWLV